MIAAVVISSVVMIFSVRTVGGFVDRHPTVKMLALSFLVLIGSALIAEGFGAHLDKAFIYGPMAFAVAVEALNIVAAKRAQKRKAGEAKPVHLHESITKG
jgi:predicted tellurium resistance membrane protein TerC